MASYWAASLGDMAVSMALSKVAGLRLLAMASTSRSCSRMPASKAGVKSASLILSKAGYWKGRLMALAKGFEAGRAAAAGAAMAGVANWDMARLTATTSKE